MWQRVYGCAVNSVCARNAPLNNLSSVRIWFGFGFGFVDGMFIDGDSEVRSLFAIGIFN